LTDAGVRKSGAKDNDGAEEKAKKGDSRRPQGVTSCAAPARSRERSHGKISLGLIGNVPETARPGKGKKESAGRSEKFARVALLPFRNTGPRVGQKGPNSIVEP